MENEYNIIYGNHSEGLAPIVDLAENIKLALEKSGVSLNACYSKEIVKNKTNIIIEEFSNINFCRKLIDIKKKFSNTKFILIITEIPINNSYNNFSNHNLFQKIPESNQLFDLNKYKLIIHFINKLLKIFRLLLYFIPKIIKNNLRKSINFDITRLDNYINFYFYARFHNTKFLISNNLFEKVYIINDSSEDLMKNAFGSNFNEFPYYIELGKKFKKEDIIFFSGTYTTERGKIFSQIESLGIKINKNFNFNDKIREELTAKCYFSLHISRYQSKYEFSSPTRSLQALKYRTLTLPLKKYMESSLERAINVPSLDTIISLKRGNTLSEHIIECYNECIENFEKLYENINKSNMQRLFLDLKK